MIFYKNKITKYYETCKKEYIFAGVNRINRIIKEK